MTSRDQIQSGPGAILATRVSEVERDHLARLARAADRTPSREVRRAIRYYLAFHQQADAYLRSEAEAER